MPTKTAIAIRDKAWANTDWSTYKGSSYYCDDPYY